MSKNRMHQFASKENTGDWHYYYGKHPPSATDELRAEYCVRLSWGYTVVIYRKYDSETGSFWEDEEEYSAGNSLYDSGVFGLTLDALDRNTLVRFARQTAREMLVERGYPKGEIHYNGSLLPRR